MMLKPHMPSLNDREGAGVPPGLPDIIDSHVHVFPENLFSAVWQWFDENGWPIRYRLSTRDIFTFLLQRGVQHVIAFQYAHKPGIAQSLNQYMVGQLADFQGRVSGLATVFPGEENAALIVQQAFDSGLAGLKLHAHVQCFDMNGREMEEVYACCADNGKPVVMHVGREPKSTAYRCDPYSICSAEKLERILMAFPGLKVCVPHLGVDEISAYRTLVEKYDNLWLDTAMATADYLPVGEEIDLSSYRIDRVMYGSDFPNIPYAWDRELRLLQSKNYSSQLLEKFLYHNAAEFFDLKRQAKR